MPKIVGCPGNGVVSLEVGEPFSPDTLDCIKTICAKGDNAITLPFLEAEIGEQVCVIAEAVGVHVAGPGLSLPEPFLVPPGQTCCFTFSCNGLWISSCSRPCECVVNTEFGRVSEPTDIPFGSNTILITLQLNVLRGNKFRIWSSWSYSHTAGDEGTQTQFFVVILSGPAFFGQVIESGVETTGATDREEAGALVSQFPFDATPIPPGLYTFALVARTAAGVATIDPIGSPTFGANNATLMVQEVLTN